MSTMPPPNAAGPAVDAARSDSPADYSPVPRRGSVASRRGSVASRRGSVSLRRGSVGGVAAQEPGVEGTGVRRSSVTSHRGSQRRNSVRSVLPQLSGVAEGGEGEGGVAATRAFDPWEEWLPKVATSPSPSPDVVLQPPILAMLPRPRTSGSDGKAGKSKRGQRKRRAKPQRRAPTVTTARSTQRGGAAFSGTKGSTNTGVFSQARPSTSPAHSRAPATLADTVRMHEEAERRQHAERNKQFFKQVLTTQYTDVPERRALKLMMAREKSRLAGEQQRHMLVLRRISERMGTYARSTNTVHRKLRKIHETLAEALAMFGVESSVLSEAYESHPMTRVHKLLMTEIGGMLRRKQLAITAMRIAREGVGTSFDQARRAYNELPARSHVFVERHQASATATEAAKKLMAAIREAQDQAYEVMALDTTTNTSLDDLHDKEQLSGLNVKAEMQQAKEASRAALDKMQAHEVLRAQVDQEIGEWTASHFPRIDPDFKAHIDALEQERLAEQAEAQRLLDEAAAVGKAKQEAHRLRAAAAGEAQEAAEGGGGGAGDEGDSKAGGEASADVEATAPPSSQS